MIKQRFNQRFLEELNALMNEMEGSMLACKRGKTKSVHGMLHFSRGGSTMFISQFPSCGEEALKESLRPFGLQVNPACVSCLAGCAKQVLEK